MFQKTDNIDFTSKDLLESIRELMAFCKQHCSTKGLSRNWGCRAQACHKQTDRLMHYGFERFVADARGGKRGEAFWDLYPDIEEEAREFAIQACTRKAASFTVEELSHFIDDKYREINDLDKDVPGLIRFVQ
ncbi:unnamed protein product, partial [Didymodactylos carnosus]